MNQRAGSELLRARALVSFAVVVAIWGSTWLVIKDQISEVPPGWTVTWRFVAACPAMFALALIRREPLRLPAEALRLALLIGLTQFCANYMFVYNAELRLTSGLVATISALMIVPNALLGQAFLDQRVTGRFLAGSAVAALGIALLILHEYRAAALGGNVIVGLLLSLAGLLSASSASVLQANSVGRRQPLVPLLAWSMLFGVLIDATYAWITSGPPQFDPRPAYALGVLYLAIFGSVVTFPLYFGLIRTIGAGRAAYSGVAVPVAAMALSTLFEGYRWTLLAAAGAVLALVGLLIALSGRRAVIAE